MVGASASGLKYILTYTEDATVTVSQANALPCGKVKTHPGCVAKFLSSIMATVTELYVVIEGLSVPIGYGSLQRKKNTCQHVCFSEELKIDILDMTDPNYYLYKARTIILLGFDNDVII